MQYHIKNTETVFTRDEFGVHFPNTSLPASLTQDDLDFLNVEEVPDPAPTAEEIAAAEAAAAEVQLVMAREQAKAQRAAAVAAIKVTTAAGNTFDGDERSQDRMARAIIALSTGWSTSTSWILADNTVIQVTGEELKEALALAGMAQVEAWII